MRKWLIYALVLPVILVLNSPAKAFQKDSVFGSIENNKDIPITRLPKTGSAALISLESLIDEALQNNPGIQAQHRRFESSNARIPQAGAWMDPKLNFSVMNFPVSDFNFGLEAMTQKQFSIMQKIPFPGITGLKTATAGIESEMSEFNFYETKNSVIKDVSIGFYDLFFTDKSIEITNKNKHVLNNFLNIANKKYEVGKGLQQDVLRAQVEISKISDRLINLESRRLTIVAKLNALLNRSSSDTIDEIQPVDYVPLQLDENQFNSIALQKRPLLSSLKSGIERNKKLFDLAKKQYWPSIDVGIAYSQRDDRRDFFSAQFSLSIPLWQGRKQDKKVEESQLNISFTENLYSDVRNNIQAQITSSTALIRETDTRISLYADIIIPQATQSLISAISGYEVDKVDFLTLLSNQISLFNLELDYYRLLTAYRKNIVTLEFVIGEKLIEIN